MLRKLLLKSEGRQIGRISMISNKILTASNGLEYYVEIMNSKGLYRVIQAFGNDAIELREVIKIMNEDSNNNTRLSYLSTSLCYQD